MTQKEFFANIAANEAVATEYREYATTQITKLEAEAEKRRNTPSKAAKETEALKPVIYEYLKTTTDYETASVIAENANIVDGEGKIRSAKVSSVLRSMVEDGTIESVKIKSLSKSGGKVNGYKIKS